MSSSSIVVENLGKRFTLRSKGLGERMSHWWSRREHAKEFWALRNLDFEVPCGQVVGVIGHNGAGKSTLLKVLTRITEPTEGRFGLRGRVSSLLEVGTGFHPELTGRENIYLSGSLLGMRRGEVSGMFDEIVAFAETERFLDTPVKRYSSGMRVRLGFAVAAHLNPEILIVDEVLAVGDASFQNRCLGKMGSFAKSGRTVLFVSHNMAAVESLCTRGILLDQGRLVFDGDSARCVRNYLAQTVRRRDMRLDQRLDRVGDGRVRVEAIGFEGSRDSPDREVRCGGELRIRFRLRSLAKYRDRVELAAIVRDDRGAAILTLHTRFTGDRLALECPVTEVICDIDELLLAPGNYRVSVWMSVAGTVADHIDDVATLEVQTADFYRSGNLPDPAKHGRVVAKHEFRVL